MNITYWNTLSLTIQLSAHNCGSVSLSEGTGNVWFLIWWSKEPKVKDKGRSSRVPQRHWTAEPQEPDQFMSLLYPWRPRDCRGWDAGVCHTVLSPCRHRWQEDKAQLAGRALQGSVLGTAGGHRSLWDSRAQAEPHLDLVEMTKHSKQFSSCTLQPSHPSDKQLST